MPAGGRNAADSTWGGKRPFGVEAGSEAMSNHTIYIGKREIWGHQVPVGISSSDHLQHVYVIGKTGSGKSTLLRNMLIQHISLGHGVGLLDPHGDLAEEILRHIPRWRTDHLAYFNPGDFENPFGFNPLGNIAPNERHLVASGIVGAFKSIWRESWGPRLEYILHNAITALLDCQNVSLLGLNRMLTDNSYRAWVVRQSRDPFVRSYWLNEYEQYDDRFRREAIAPIQNKVGQFLLSPVIRNILGQVKNRLRIEFTMDNQRLLIANLAKGRLGDDKSNLLGCLLVTQFQLAAMRRANLTDSERKPFYLFIDEFQNFSTDSFVSILAEARKYGLGLVLSHQYVDQVPLAVRQSVFGNVATLISFRVGYNDAEALQAEYGNSYPANCFVDLDPYQMIVRLTEDGRTREPFQTRSLKPLYTFTGSEALLRSRSVERFTSRRISVENNLRRWMSGH